MRSYKSKLREIAIHSAKKSGLLWCFLSVTLVYVGLGRAQERQSNSRQISELGRENLSRAAASATDLKAILIKDAGLMVELKRWIAKDATGFLDRCIGEIQSIAAGVSLNSSELPANESDSGFIRPQQFDVLLGVAESAIQRD